MKKNLASNIFVYYIRKPGVHNWKCILVSEKDRVAISYKDSGEVGHRHTWSKRDNFDQINFWAYSNDNGDFDRYVSYNGRDEVFEMLYL